MLIRNLLFILSIFIVSSCGKPSVENLFGRERDKKIYGALRKFKTAMEAKGFHAVGIGEGIDHSTGKQNYLGVTFNIEKLPNIDFARKIEVKTLQDLLQHINSEEGIQDYIAVYPFTLEFIHVAFISQHREEGLFLVANFHDEIYYCQDTPENPMGPSIEVHRESYEDAVKILAQ